MGVVGEDKLTWMSEYAEFHQLMRTHMLTQVTLQVWGAVVAAQPSGLAGQTLGNYANGVGSGDIGQNLYQ
jgi:hypothetical protein